ncbi:hypothetical protein PR048_033758 [Dryococelus australis]|uniref:Nucleic-acid-binding protein from transposon X-element n=1 Tax=Dryococelus australis TaxID=614101 RepID=A0ABQ9FZ16_9NEOP|nr:hypothetical protein PR048_033758 [Dryococelus australis]
MMEFLTAKKALPFTRPFKEDRNTNVVISNIPADMTPDELQMELKNLGFHIRRVRQFERKGENPFKFRKFQVTLEGTTQASSIMQLTRIDIYRVTVEKYRPLGPQQCRRCQEYGHNATDCGREMACFKCSGNHWSHECPVPKTTPPTCPNCGENHLGGSKDCRVRQKFEQRHTRTQSKPTLAQPKRSPEFKLNPSEFMPLQPPRINAWQQRTTTNASADGDKTQSQAQGRENTRTPANNQPNIARHKRGGPETNSTPPSLI